MSLSKSQVTIEMILIIIFLIIFLTAFAGVVYYHLNHAYSESIEFEIKRIGNELSGQINLALEEGNGYKKKYFLQEKIQGLEYNVTVDSANGRIGIEVNGNTYFFPVLTRNISGNFSKGENIIRNENGLIIIE